MNKALFNCHKPKLIAHCRQSYNCGNKIPMFNNRNAKFCYFT